MAATLLLLAVTIYARTADFPFLFDDQNNIRDNPHVHLKDLSWDGLWQAARHGVAGSRPVAYLSFALNHRVGGLDPPGYRWVNVAVHALCGLLVYALALRTLALHARLPGQLPPLSHAGTRVATAWLAAAIFVAHPLQTQSVTYIVQRMTSLSALFSLLALLCWLEGRSRQGGKRRGFWSAAAVAWTLGLGSKETAASLPFVVLSYEWLFFRDLGGAWLRRHAALLLLGLGTFAGLGALYLQAYPYGWETYGFTPGERMLSELRVLWRYLALVVWPLPSQLNLSHEVAVSHSLFDPPTTLLAGLGLLLLCGLAGVVARQRRLAAFAVAWFFVNLALESSFLPIELMYEHRLYLPLFGPALLFAHALFGFSARPSAAAIAAGLAVVTLLAAAAWLRNDVWRSETALWSDVVAKSPGDARAWNNLGSAHEQAERFEQAATCLTRAVELDPSYPRAEANLGIVLHRLARLEEAIPHYDAALRLDPDNPDTLRNRASAHLAVGQPEHAIADYRSAVRIDSGSARAHYGLGLALAGLERWEEAASALEAARRLDPDDEAVLRALGGVLQMVRSRGGGGAAHER